MADSIPATLAHMDKVRVGILWFCRLMERRAAVHDASKLKPVEKGPLDELQRLIELEGPAPYGSDGYKQRSAILAPMLAHHYANNDHHPEHHGDKGIAGMSLMSLVEMFCDWRAANVERDGGEPMNLSYSIDKWKIEPQLAAILKNTARELGWGVK